LHWSGKESYEQRRNLAWNGRETVKTDIYDLAVIGGGINGCGIARDAAGRGHQTVLLEQNDLASATSSNSTKLIHGGLRYLEHYEFSLVRKALIERESARRLAKLGGSQPKLEAAPRRRQAAGL